MTGDETDVVSPTALAYQMTEEARLLLGSAPPGELQSARTAVAEAAYYLSDSLEPDARISLLALAERRSPAGEDGECAEAMTLLVQVADEVEEMLAGRGASAELRSALRALRRAIGALARELGLHPTERPPQPPGARGRLQSRHG